MSRRLDNPITRETAAKFVVRAQLPLGWFGSERVLPNSAPFVRGLFG
ncbi:hypothetical protein ACW9HJ_01225 [Nocardia gipuzkoensis]